MPKLIQSLAGGVFFLSALTSSYAISDTVTIPEEQQGFSQQELSRPTQGMSKEQVQLKYGEPNSFRDPIGDPPISSWTYEHFTVYFEYESVIHSVMTRKMVN